MSPHPACPVGHHPPEHPCEYPDCKCFGMGGSSRPVLAVVGGVELMTHAEATAAVRNVNGKINALDRERKNLVAERDACMQRQRDTVDVEREERKANRA